MSFEHLPLGGAIAARHIRFALKTPPEGVADVSCRKQRPDVWISSLWFSPEANNLVFFLVSFSFGLVWRLGTRYHMGTESLPWNSGCRMTGEPQPSQASVWPGRKPPLAANANHSPVLLRKRSAVCCLCPHLCVESHQRPMLLSLASTDSLCKDRDDQELTSARSPADQSDEVSKHNSS